MDKIVILTDSSERGGTLASCLRILFPECEIRVALEKMADPEDVRKDSEPATVDTGREKEKKPIIDNRNIYGGIAKW